MNKRLIFVGLFCGTFFCSCSQKTEFQFLDDFVINYENDLFTNAENLSYWENKLKDKQIILLGEIGHTDGSTFLLKIELIKFLHSKLGYDVLFLESANYAFFNNPSINDATKNNKQSCLLNWNPVWSYTDQLEKLYLYLDSCRTTNPLYLFSCDVATDTKEPFGFLMELKQYLSKVNYQKQHKIDWNIVLKIRENAHKYSKDIYTMAMENIITEQEWLQLLENMKLLESVLNIYENELENKNKNKFYLQCLTNGIYEIENLLICTNTNDASNEMIKKRDSLMFQIIDDFCKQNPDRKIMVWSANFHIANNLNEVIYSPDTSFYNFMIPLGHHLRRQYRDKVYSIAFNHSDNIETLNDTTKNTIEYYLYNQSSSNFSFIDFEKMRENAIYADKIFPSYLIYGGQSLHFGKWFHLFDGVFFIRNHQPSTIQGKTWQELLDH